MNEIKQKLNKLTELINCIYTLDSYEKYSLDENITDRPNVLKIQKTILDDTQKTIDEILRVINNKKEHIIRQCLKEEEASHTKPTSDYIYKSDNENSISIDFENENTVTEKEPAEHIETKHNNSLEQHTDAFDELCKKESPKEMSDNINKLSVQVTTTDHNAEKPKISDLKQAISIADRFRFQRELFGGNGEKMSETIATLNNMLSIKEALDHISITLQWDNENPVVKDFITILKRKF